jgi:phosphatidylglycerophosphate synthase
MSAKENYPLWAAAQVLTAVRLLLIIPFFYCELTYNYTAVLIVLLAAAATDILDGILARRSGVHRLFGKAFDFAADFAFILAVAIYFQFTGYFIGYFFIAPLAAGITYILLCIRRKGFVRTRLGRWNGTIAFGGIIALAGYRAIVPEFSPAVWQWFSLFLAGWFLVSAIECISAHVTPANDKTLDKSVGCDKIE